MAPYLVVLMHLNLLLQLQLLSRKLFAFDAATPAEEGVGGLRDRLHIFPYTYYLVGRPGVVVGGLLGLVVSVTLIVLPLATLLALQLKFLAYQAEGITWAQRVAVFLDVGLLVALWPVILHPRDDWQAWWRETLAAYLPKKRAWLAVVVLVASVMLILFGATPDIFTVGLILGAVAPLLLIVLAGALLGRADAPRHHLVCGAVGVARRALGADMAFHGFAACRPCNPGRAVSGRAAAGPLLASESAAWQSGIALGAGADAVADAGADGGWRGLGSGDGRGAKTVA
ncbi:MAG: hypothetical protein V9H25_05440 [Candidatus Competibacter sp.]